MTSLETIQKISQKYSVSPEEFIKLGSCLAMREKKRAMQIEKIEILARYGASTVEGLESKIKNGDVPEHPAWEDLIEIRNLETEIREIDNDITVIQQA